MIYKRRIHKKCNRQVYGTKVKNAYYCQCSEYVIDKKETVVKNVYLSKESIKKINRANRKSATIQDSRRYRSYLEALHNSTERVS